MTSPSYLLRLTPAQKAALRTQLQADLEKKIAASKPAPSIIDYVAALYPFWERFDYFAPYTRELENAIGGGLRLCFAAPPQHGKTEVTLHAFLWLCRYRPGHQHGYVTYNDDRAKDVAKHFRHAAHAAGFTVTGTLSKMELRFEGGIASTVQFTSIGGPLTGFSLTGLLVIDDPIKDREEARSPTIRRRHIDWYETVGKTRRAPGLSIIVMATRWPGGDLTDHLTKKRGWKYINLKAIATGPTNDNGVVTDDPLGRKAGESLCKRRPPEFFREDQADLFWWASMFQGEPQAQGLRVFAEPGTVAEDGRHLGPPYYRELPKEGYRVAFGVDLACTAKTSADWSVCIEGWEHDRKLYIVNVTRKQVDAPSFLLTLVACRANRPGAVFRFYGSGTEKGTAQFIQRKLGRCFKFLNASADKLVRATPAAAAWNQGNILLPDPDAIDAPWLDDFLAIVVNFTGTPGETDDDADALAALHDQLMHRSAMFEALGSGV